MSDYINKSALIEQLTEWANRNEMKGLLTECNVVRGCIGVVESQETLDEKEIIRKPFERVVERLEEKKRSDGTESDREWGKYIGYVDSIKILKEECGISE